MVITNKEGMTSGKLFVRVTAGRGTFPIHGATVYIREYDNEGEGHLLYILRTNEGGLSDTVTLSAPDSSSSLIPNSSTLPYSEYVVTVIKNGFYTVENIGVPIFEGITSIQDVDMVPLSETDRLNGFDGITKYNENGGYSKLNGNAAREGL